MGKNVWAPRWGNTGSCFARSSKNIASVLYCIAIFTPNFSWKRSWFALMCAMILSMFSNCRVAF